MLRILFCISCCSAPPSNSSKRRSSSNQQLKSSDRGSSKQELRERKVSQEESKNDAPLNINEKKAQALANQIETINGDYGTKKSNASQGKITLPVGENKQVDYDYDYDYDRMIRGAADSIDASTSVKRVRRADAIDASELDNIDFGRLKDLGAELRNFDDGSVSPPSSIDVGPFTEGATATTATTTTTTNLDSSSAVNRARAARASLDADDDDDDVGADEQELAAYTRQQGTQISYSGLDDNGSGSPSRTTGQQYEPLASSNNRDVPSTTKIGDYARIEYSPIDDLDSVTTMSYSRFGSEKGGSRSQAGSTLSRQNSTKATPNAESRSRRSSHGGIESTSISIASQLSNEQFQQNLTNMLESVNTNYSTLGTIGLPLGPPLEGNMTETTKTSPETPGAALTSASQDSLSDIAFDEISPMSSRPGTLRSNRSVGAALIGSDSLERAMGPEDMADLAQPAPLVSGEEDGEGPQQQQSYSGSGLAQQMASERVDSPQSITTTMSGGLTNPTPTPSEMSGGSGKKKKSKAKSLFKKLKPGSKKNKGD